MKMSRYCAKRMQKLVVICITASRCKNALLAVRGITVVRATVMRVARSEGDKGMG